MYFTQRSMYYNGSFFGNIFSLEDLNFGRDGKMRTVIFRTCNLRTKTIKNCELRLNELESTKIGLTDPIWAKFKLIRRFDYLRVEFESQFRLI